MAMPKRVLSAVLALALLLSCIPMTAVAAETEEPTIAAEAPAEVPAGETGEEPTQAPAETAEEPTEAPAEETEAPVEETEVPAEEPTEAAPAETTAPTEATEAPAETTAPTEATEAPAEEPAEAPTEPVETVEATAAQEAVNATTSGSCGYGLTWTFDDSTGTLTISGSGAMWDYGYNPWGSIGAEIKSVVIQDGVASIGHTAFYDCTSLTSVVIPDSVTSIGGSAFAGCTSLTSVNIPDSDTSIGNAAFFGCSSLTSITIPEGVTSIGDYAFYDCSSLASIAIPSSVTSIGTAPFANCNSLTGIWVDSNNAFYSSDDQGVLFDKNKTVLHNAPCTVTTYEIPDGVTSIGDNAFSGCSGLTDITIPEGVTSIGSSAFWGCSSLTSIAIPDGVTSIGDTAFCGCSSLTNVTIPDSVISIGSWVFSACINLTDITIPEGVTNIGDHAFYNCRNLTSITIPAGVTSIGDSAFNGCGSLTSIAIPSGVTSIGEWTFANCSSLTSITIPSGVTSIGYGAFSLCSSLTSVTIPDSVTSIGDYVFNYCTSLTSITLPSGVTSIGEAAFYGCHELKEMTIPEGVTEIGRNAFDGVGMGTITIPSSVVTMGEGALNSWYFDKIVFLGNVPEVISDSDSPELFYKYSSLLKVFYPVGNTSWTEAAKQALSQGVTNIIFIPFDTAMPTSGSCGADLRWSVDLETKTLTISGTGPMDAWDWVDTFAPWAYYGEEIETVVIGAGVTSICDGAFLYTYAETLRFSGNAPDIGVDIQHRTYNVTAYYPAGDDTWDAVIPRFPNITWVREGSAFASLKEIVAKCDSMTPEEIRAAVQALDRDELLASMRSQEAISDLNDLDSAVQAGYAVIEVSAEIPELEANNTPMHGYATGASLNDLISTDEVVTIRLDRVGTALPIPAGYNGDSAIQFALSMDNVQDPEYLKVPVQITVLLPYSINPFFADVFWRNSETGVVEKLPTYCTWSKAGGVHLSFVVTGTGDYCIVPRSNGSVSGVCGDDLTWTYDESGTLTISGSGEMYDYGKTSDLAPWAYYRENVDQIAIGEYVTSIGAYAFDDCRFAYRLTIPASVRKIAAGAFGGLFTEYIIFEGSAPEVAADSFDGMSAIAYYPDGDATWDSVITQSEWGGAERLTWTVAALSGSCGENAAWAFDEATGTLTISGNGAMADYEYSSKAPWDYIAGEITSAVIQDGITGIGDYAFFGCSSLSSITIADSITSIGDSAFDGCSSLTSVTIPSGVASIGNSAFADCSSLTSIAIPSGVTSISRWTFYGCSNLTNITIPDSVTSIGSDVFCGCTSLADITIPASVTSIGDYAFYHCDDLTTITFLGNAPQFMKDEYSDAETPQIFTYVTATAYYPANNATWTADVMQDYGGTITWVAYGETPAVPDKPYKVINVATGIQVYWEAVEDAAGYGVWRSEAENGEYALLTTATSTLYTDTKVDPGQTYYYRISALDDSGEHTDKSDSVSITFVTAPKVVAATSGAYAYWTAIPGAAEYGVWCSKNGINGDFELLGTTTATNYTNRSVPSGTTYYYAISIVNADGTHSALSKAINHTFLSTPSITSRTNVAEGMKLTWNKINGALGYAIYRKTYTSSVWTRVATIEKGDTLTWTDTSVRAKNGQAYHYTIRALAGSKLTIQSAQRINGTPIVRLTAQTLKSTVRISSTAIKCAWSTSTVVTGYEVRLMSGGSVYKSYIVPGKTTSTKALTGLPRGRTYTVQIRTYKTLDAGTYYSAWSNAKNVYLS